MAAPTPATDPNFAWDTQGWTNQGNTGDVEGENPTGSGVGFPSNAIADPGELSGYALRTMDPTGLVAGAFAASTVTSNYGIMGLVQCVTPLALTKAVFLATTAGTITHGFAFLVDMSGTVQAQTADIGVGPLSTTAATAWSWTSASLFWNSGLSKILVPTGLYYLGLSFTNSVQPNLAGCAGTGTSLDSFVVQGGGLTAGSYRFAITGATMQTTPGTLNSSITLSSTAALGTSAAASTGFFMGAY